MIPPIDNKDPRSDRMDGRERRWKNNVKQETEEFNNN